MTRLTKRQADTLDFIASWTQFKGHAPTLMELGQAFGINTNAANDRIKGLIQKGYVQRGNLRQCRTISLTPKGRPENRDCTVKAGVLRQ